LPAYDLERRKQQVLKMNNVVSEEKEQEILEQISNHNKQLKVMASYKHYKKQFTLYHSNH